MLVVGVFRRSLCLCCTVQLDVDGGSFTIPSFGPYLGNEWLIEQKGVIPMESAKIKVITVGSVGNDSIVPVP